MNSDEKLSVIRVVFLIYKEKVSFLSGCFQGFLFVYSFQKFNYDIPWHGFSFLICRFMYFAKFGNFSTIIFASTFFFFWPCHAACGILVPQPGIEPTPPALEAQSLNNWTPGKSLQVLLKFGFFLLSFWDTDDTNVSSFGIVPLFPEALCIYFSIFSLLFKMSNLYCSIFQFTDSFLLSSLFYF